MRRALRVLAKLLKALCGALTAASMATAALCLLAMVVIIFYQVCARKIARTTPAWSEEVALLLMVYFSLFGAAAAYRGRLHIGVELLRNRLRGRVRRAWDLLLDLVVLGFGAAMVGWGMDMVMLQIDEPLPGSGLSMAWKFIPLPVAGGLLALLALEKIVLGDRRTPAEGDAAA